MKIIVTDQFRKAAELCEEITDPHTAALSGDKQGRLGYDDHQTLRYSFAEADDQQWCPPADIDLGSPFAIADRPDIKVSVYVFMNHNNDGLPEGFQLEAVLQVDDEQTIHRTTVACFLDWIDLPDVTPGQADKPATFIDQLVTFAELVVATLNESLAQDMKFWVAAAA